ncbi:MAG: hypothetical protein QOH25_3401 [Acidobacteriota bacterium]|jgi:hypothetical protein|nr:hypothetical protein [Acidobacteriota bacterium]
MSPLRGLTIYSILVPTADAVGYWYSAPPGLKVEVASYVEARGLIVA